MRYCNYHAMFKTILVFSIALLLLPSDRCFGASNPPNGLCILKSAAGGWGHGFVVGSYLFSSALVFAKANGDFFCVQDEQLVNITELKDSKPTMPPQFNDTSEALQKLDKERNDDSSIRKLEAFAKQMYDVGFIRLSDPLKSDFRLNGSLKLSELFALLESVDASDDETAFFKSQNKYTRLSSSGGSFPMEVEFDEARQQFRMFSRAEGDHSFKFFLDYEMDLEPGAGGAPFFHEAKDGKLIVSGILTGNYPAGVDFDSPDFPSEYRGRVPSKFSSLVSIIPNLPTELFYPHDPNGGQCVSARALIQ